MSAADLRARLAAARKQQPAKSEPVVEQKRDEEQLDLVGDIALATPPTPRTPHLFRQYVEHGWSLCPIREGEKRPRGEAWNKRENGITDPERAAKLIAAGLMHAFSGTCAIDVDAMDEARVWLKKHGIDLDALFNAPDAVHITRGGENRGKLIYALSEPLPTKQIKSDDKSFMLFELRCSATTGNSAQDVLPPTRHPKGELYQWAGAGDWRKLPELPKPLHDLWLSLVRPTVERTREELAPTAHLVELRRLIEQKDPDAAYDEWLKVGQAIHHETQGGDDGLALWDEWSAQSGKYPGHDQLAYKWQSFGNAPNPVTAGWLRQGIVATVEDFGAPLDPSVFDEAMRSLHAEQVARFKWAKLGEHKKLPPPRWLIKAVLPLKPINMMFGPSGAGKSLIGLDMALAVARGVLWHTFKVVQGAVGWIAAEAVGSMRNRSLAYEKSHDVNVDDTEFYVLGEGIDLTNRESVVALAESAPKGLALLIVDTLAAAAGSANENSGEDMNPVLDNCKLLHEITGASVLLIHHSGKDEAKGSRGWSGIKARVDAQIEVKKRAGHPTLRDVFTEKMRDGDEGLVASFEVGVLAVDMDDDGDLIKSAFVKFADPQATLTKANATRKGQGKWHRAIRETLMDAPDMQLEGEALIKAAKLKVPEDKRTTKPRQQLLATLNEMVELGELRAVDGVYEFVMPTTVSAMPDPAPGVDDDADADLL